ncbi:hypothetical protein F5883DRAFT_433436, partial [Diaporthe sp. PMI_573]
DHFMYTPVTKSIISHLASKAYGVIQCVPQLMPPTASRGTRPISVFYNKELSITTDQSCRQKSSEGHRSKTYKPKDRTVLKSICPARIRDTRERGCRVGGMRGWADLVRVRYM